MAQIAVLLVFAFEATAIWFAWRAIASARTAQGAIGWVILLVAAPFIAVPAYFLLGHHKYKGYLISRRTSQQVIDAVRRISDTDRPDRRPVIDPTPFERIADLPAVRGNDARPLIDGDETFAAIFAAIDAAEHYILVQFYIVHDDIIGRALHDRLTAAARRGVHVRFMVDSVGSRKLPRSYCDSLRDAGADVVGPREGKGPKRRIQLNFRNHRKTVVVDGRVGFTGGLNVGDEYMGRDPVFGRWRDTHVELRGPIVAQLQLIFAEDWHWARGEVILEDLAWRQSYAEADMTALLVATGPGDQMETGALFFFSAIAAATDRLWIASPYCVPDRDVLTALKHAALRGLDVRLLLPEVIDHRITWLAAFAFFDELREAGVQIWRYRDGFMHQKVVLVDNDLAAIGTTNLDNRSFRLNFEAMAVLFDSRAASDIAGFLERDFTRAQRLDRTLAEQSVFLRVGAPVARLFSPLL